MRFSPSELTDSTVTAIELLGSIGSLAAGARQWPEFALPTIELLEPVGILAVQGRVFCRTDRSHSRPSPGQ